MHGLKGEYLRGVARELGCNYAALEYRGQGMSHGNYLDHSLQDWIDDVLFMVDTATPGAAYILVGSSLGAWLALHAALARPQAVQGLLLVAPAVDISQHWAQVASPASAAGCEQSQEPAGAAASAKCGAGGPSAAPDPDLVLVPSSYMEGGSIVLQRSMIQQATQRHLLLSGPGAVKVAGLHCAVHILYSERDDAVPREIPERLAHVLELLGNCPHLCLENVPDGDHRLSREGDLERMRRALQALSAHGSPAPNNYPRPD
ncbi:hypothetical protein N2152v2_000387 [Parachlorella kessleri]